MFEDVQASTALKRAVTQQSDEHAYQELRKEHDLLTSRLGIDMGEVRVEGEDGQAVDVFGVNVDTAARAMSLVDGGHVCVTAPVYRDAFSCITKSRLAWKKHGFYRAKPGDLPIKAYQPYNANHHRPMRQLRGEKAEVGPAARVSRRRTRRRGGGSGRTPRIPRPPACRGTS